MTWTFLVSNALYGFGFVALNGWSGVYKSSLYQSIHETGNSLPEFWGSLLFVSAVLSVVAVYMQNAFVGAIGAVGGLASWLFASLIYLQTGYLLVFFTVGVLYLMFWISYYFSYISKISDNRLGSRS